MIYIGMPVEMDDELFMKQLERLDQASKRNNPEIKRLVADVVNTYHEPVDNNKASAHYEQMLG